jgi:competence protein ComEC
MMRGIVTRFRAYQLGVPGSAFSYFADGEFTLIEGRLTDVSRPSLIHEMKRCGIETANTLHITSWDADHCSKHELQELLDLTRPLRVECPGYDPYTDHGEGCLEIISSYRDTQTRSNRVPKIVHITPRYIDGLEEAEAAAFKDTLYNPRHIDPDCPNDNSTVQHFRKGSFNVLSLGDVESSNIGARMRRSRILRTETDVMILAHHGADNGFTTKKFLAHLEPRLAICSSNYDNQYDHPREEIRELLHEQEIRLMTTKTGDVIVKSIGDHGGRYRAINLKGNSQEVSSTMDFQSKKSRILSFNADTLRQRYQGQTKYGPK